MRRLRPKPASEDNDPMKMCKRYRSKSILTSKFLISKHYWSTKNKMTISHNIWRHHLSVKPVLSTLQWEKNERKKSNGQLNLCLQYKKKLHDYKGETMNTKKVLSLIPRRGNKNLKCSMCLTPKFEEPADMFNLNPVLDLKYLFLVPLAIIWVFKPLQAY